MHHICSFKVTIPFTKKVLFQKKPGWNKDISGCKSWDELPKEAKGYVEFLEKQLDHEIQFVSTGAEREKFVLKGEWL